MSEADNITKLKTTVEIYEKELKDKSTYISNLSKIDPPDISNPITLMVVNELPNVVEIYNKLLNAYREYVQAIQKYIPR